MVEFGEAELIDRARKGDSAAFGQLVRMHQRRLYAVAVQMLANPAQAEDAVQEALLRAYRAIDRFDGRSELSTWLYRICVNVCLNHIRRRKRHGAADVDDPRVPEPAADPQMGQTDPAEAADLSRLQRRVGEALSRLSPSLRATVVLVLIEGVSHKQAAEVLGCPEGTVAWRIHEARRKLRLDLTDVLAAHGSDSVRPAADGSGRSS